MIVKFKSLENWGKVKKIRFTKSHNFGHLIMCKRCYTFYYKHSWNVYQPKVLRSERDLTLPVKFTECPTCVVELEGNPEEGGSPALRELEAMSS